MNRDRSQGFTMVELMIVLVLIAIVGAIAFPWLTRSNPQRLVLAAARAAHGNIQQARLIAQRENRPIYVDFGQDLDNNGSQDVVLWRDLPGTPMNGLLEATDNDGNGIPDEIDGPSAIFLNTANDSPYGRNYPGVAIGPGPVGQGPPNAPLGTNTQFTEPFGNTTSAVFTANADGTCTPGAAYFTDVTNAQATYCLVVSAAGSVQLWRWTAANQAWGRM